ncbi:hypothetical protein ABZV78_06270 [Micromonospora sp. NPDC004540]|uniref:hypothetical protein n=1 Tax=Micromonospora sp. NPDC004540 TaxID=3154457 RepID=UPI0033A51B75
MAVLRRRWQSGAAVALLASMVTIGPAACTSLHGERTPQPSTAAVPTMAPRQLRNPVSVQVVARIDQAACVEGAGGLPGPGAGGDWCYFLDPGLNVTRAERVELVQDALRDFVVVVTLLPEDRDEFAAWTARAAGRQIAISVQGRVVAAPELLEPLSGDDLHIYHPGIAEAAARTLLRQLSG